MMMMGVLKIISQQTPYESDRRPGGRTPFVLSLFKLAFVWKG